MKLKRKLLAAIMIAGLAGAGLTACSSSGSGGDGKSLVIWQYEDATPPRAGLASGGQELQEGPPRRQGHLLQSELRLRQDQREGPPVRQQGPRRHGVQQGSRGRRPARIPRTARSFGRVREEVRLDQDAGQRQLHADVEVQQRRCPRQRQVVRHPQLRRIPALVLQQGLLRQHNLQVPKTQAELTELMQKIKDDGTTPVSAAAKEFPYMQTWFQYVLQNAPKDWTKCYQLFQCKVDFDDTYWKDGTKAAEDAVAKGYVANNISGITHEQMGTNFLQQKNPLMMSDPGGTAGWRRSPSSTSAPSRGRSRASTRRCRQPLGRPCAREEQGPRRRVHQRNPQARRPDLMADQAGFPSPATSAKSRTNEPSSSPRTSRTSPHATPSASTRTFPSPDCSMTCCRTRSRSPTSRRPRAGRDPGREVLRHRPQGSRVG